MKLGFLFILLSVLLDPGRVIQEVKMGKYQRELKKKGQSVYEFSNYYLFKLQEKYRTAGKKYWPKAVENGEPTPGFSLNSAIYETIPLNKILVFEVADSRFYKMVDRGKALRLKGENRRNGVLLHVLPLSAFATVEIEDVERIIESPVSLSKADLTTRQQKLKVVS